MSEHIISDGPVVVERQTVVVTLYLTRVLKCSMKCQYKQIPSNPMG